MKKAREVCRFGNMTIQTYKFYKFLNEENSVLMNEVVKVVAAQTLKIKMNVSAFEKIEELKEKKKTKQPK